MLKRLICTLMTFVLALLWGGNLVFEAYATDVRTELISRKTITDKICLISEQIRLLISDQIPLKEKLSEQTTMKISEPPKFIPSINNNEDWMLTLVNYNNPLPDTYKPVLKSLSNGLQFDARAIDQLNLMLSDARAQGLSPVVCSAYRSVEYQQKLFNNQVKKQMAKGLDRQQAELEAQKVVAYPGTSEHNLGLAADIVSLSYQHLDQAQANTAEVKWLTRHCSEYGFILRYPEGKTNITGVIYEPWHFRYVGIDAAKEIMESGQCLEEYLEFKESALARTSSTTRGPYGITSVMFIQLIPFFH